MSLWPRGLCCVAGDFNQNRDGTRWYRDYPDNEAAVELLSRALDKVSLKCVTEDDMRTQHGISRANIDHICLPTQIDAARITFGCWDGDGMSDHNGVFVDVEVGGT